MSRTAGEGDTSHPWHERVTDFIYFYDFYLVSALLFVAVLFYLMASS